MNGSSRVQLRWLCLLTIVVCLAAGGLAFAAEIDTSRLWGKEGELWTAEGRLPDFSYAGYHRGERPLPELRADVSVRDFGAVGDGKTDDTAAFMRAIKEAAGKTIAVPAGRYVITDILEIGTSGTVLQGAGPEKTTIYVPKPLEKIRSNMGATTSGRPTSNYSWSGGILSVQGQSNAKVLSKVIESARRGETTLTVEQPGQFKIGDEVSLSLHDDDQRGLTHHLYAGDPGDFAKLHPVTETWIARVEKIDGKAKRIVFDRPLRTDLRLE